VVSDVRAALWGDFDNDGLIDVYLCRDGTNQLWRQTAKGQWANITAAAHADGGGGVTIDGALFDADHDGDLDLLLIKRDGGDELLNNNGDGTFRPIGVRIGLTDQRPSSTVVIADLDADRDADIVVIKKAAPPTVLLNDRTWQYHREPGFGTSGPSIVAAVAGDTDADGRVEIFTSGEGGIARWTRASLGTWTSALLTGTGNLAASTQLALADIDGDGRPDLIGTRTDGRVEAVTITADGTAAPLFSMRGAPVAGWTLAVLDATRGPSLVAMPAGGSRAPLMWRPGAGRFPFVTIALSGRDPRSTQLRSNVSGIGTQLAARSGSQWSAFATYRSQSGPGQSLQPLSIGTGGRPQIDFVALTWSDGVLQSELMLAPGFHAIAETERQLSSCPVLFPFDDHSIPFTKGLVLSLVRGSKSPGDYVEGMWRILQHHQPDDFVLATGEARSVREFVEAAFGRLALGQLSVAGKLVAQGDEPIVPLKTPGVVFEGAQIKTVEGSGSALTGKSGELEFGGSVLLAEKEAEGVFGIAGASAITAADADTAIDVEALRAVRINQFNGSGPLPRGAIPARVGINAYRGIK
jgi:hypothetical protein